ncbi:MAG: group II intron reverse transcriptase/maturase [Acidobacteriota bacterium]
MSGERLKWHGRPTTPPQRPHDADPGEARASGAQEAQHITAKQQDERLSTTPDAGPTMEEVLERANMFRALKRVQANRGAPGPDGMTTQELPESLKKQWPAVRQRLLNGTYVPQPVRRKAIPKPDGGERELGIPTVLDRLIQQAILQVLQPRWDPTFSEHSYGFRPGRSAHQAVARAQEHVAAGFDHVVDIDIEKFFDRVNHDLLMGRVAQRITDKRLLKLLRRYLEAGLVLANGVTTQRTEGTPQGGPLSPLLANLLLDELDRELQHRDLRFVRYADDCNIYVRSARSAERVMKSITAWLQRKLRLKVNPVKSAAAPATTRTFLGFVLRHKTSNGQVIREIAPKSLDKAKHRLRSMTHRVRGQSVTLVAREAGAYLRGWWAYFGHAETHWQAQAMLGWVRRRLRQLQWIQWKTPQNRRRQLLRHGCVGKWADYAASAACGPWRASNNHGINKALGNEHWRRLGIPEIGGPTKR